jgi:hypothetical protein
MDTTAELNESIISTSEREYVFPDFKVTFIFPQRNVDKIHFRDLDSHN